MTAWLLLSLFVSFAIGWLTVSLLWPAGARVSRAQLPLRIFLGFGLGQGITSCIAFLYLLVNGRVSVLYYLCELAVLACLIIIFCLKMRKIKASPSALPPARPDRSGAGNAVLLAIAFYATAATALMTIALRLSRWPHGGYDAWTNWNLRARAIFRGGAEWHDFSSHLLHPDYPLLLPLSVVRTWMYAGSDTIAAPMILAWLFAAAILGLVTSAVATLCGRPQGYVAGVVLLGHPFFVLHGSTQMAEAPLTFFYVAALVLIAFHNDAAEDEGSGALVLAGLMAGFAAWTKNEGLLFLVALGVAHFAVVVRATGLRAYRKQLLSLATGLLPVVAVLIYFKTQFALSNVWVSKMSTPEAFAHLTDAGRYVVIAKEFARRFLFYSGWGINMTYLLLMFVLCFGGTRRHIISVAQAALALSLMMAGVVWIYLTVNPNVGAFMRFSLDRVLFQLWPAFVVTFFLLAAPADVYLPGRERQRAPGTPPA
jgi:hypothetical protein